MPPFTITWRSLFNTMWTCSVPALSSARRALRAPLATEFVSSSGLGLSSSQEAPSGTDGEDYIVPDKKSEGETPEIVTRSATVTLLAALCREVAPNFEFVSEQHTYRVNTGRLKMMAALIGFMIGRLREIVEWR